MLHYFDQLRFLNMNTAEQKLGDIYETFNVVDRACGGQWERKRFGAGAGIQNRECAAA